MNASDLRRFCADANDIRWYIRNPWSRDKYTYATNGHILLRVTRLDDVPEEPKAPDAAALITKIAPASNWMPVPVATMPPMVDCPDCDGTGIIEGEGPDDDSFDCEWCGKTGKVRAYIGVEVSGVWFDQGYLSMIQGWAISPDGYKPAPIRNVDDGVDGLLMPRTRP